MGSLSDYSENALLDHLFNAAYTPAANIYLAFCTDPPIDADDGAAITECADANGYARTLITFLASSARKVVQDGVVTFPEASGAWGEVDSWALMDGNTHGADEVLAHGSFGTPFSPVSGNTPSIADSQVEVEIAATGAGAGFTTACVDNLLDLMFNGTAFSTPAGNTFVALLAAVPDDDDATVGDLTEITGTDYAREEVSENGGSAPAWDLAAAGVVDNGAIITMGPPGAEDWDEVVAMAIVSAISGAGAVYCYDAANIVDQTPTSADTVQFAAGALDLTLT